MESRSGAASAARSFGAAAGAYERGRPPYPAEAIDWLLPTGARRVLDLGAGTGKLTRLLAERGLEVVAVEPLDEMREQLVAAAPGVVALAGTAERIPLPDGAVDAVLAAQAWHWVDPARAAPEAGRVLRPGGGLWRLWNVRDEREPWVAELGELMHARAGQGREMPPVVGEPFGELEHTTVAWHYQLDRDALLDLVASRSYVILLADEDRARLLAEVDALARRHPALAGRERFDLPYVTHCFRARRR